MGDDGGNVFEIAYDVNRVIQSIAFQISIHNMHYDNFGMKFGELYEFVSDNLDLLFRSKLLYAPIVIRSRYETDSSIHYFLDMITNRSSFDMISETNSKLGVDVVCIIGISDVSAEDGNMTMTNSLSITIMYPTGKTYCMASELTATDDSSYHVDLSSVKFLQSDELGLFGINPWVGEIDGC